MLLLLGQWGCRFGVVIVIQLQSQYQENLIFIWVVAGRLLPFCHLPGLTTGKKADPNKPVMVSPTWATINGVLLSFWGISPTETGIVWREIVGNDFGTVPDGTGAARVPTYKTARTLLTRYRAVISVSIPTLPSRRSSTRPYYFRTYAKGPLGIGYGNHVIFNCVPAVISPPVVTGDGTLIA